MKKKKWIVWIVLLTIIAVLLGIVAYGYYTKYRQQNDIEGTWGRQVPLPDTVGTSLYDFLKTNPDFEGSADSLQEELSDVFISETVEISFDSRDAGTFKRYLSKEDYESACNRIFEVFGNHVREHIIEGLEKEGFTDLDDSKVEELVKETFETNLDTLLRENFSQVIDSFDNLSAAADLDGTFIGADGVMTVTTPSGSVNFQYAKTKDLLLITEENDEEKTFIYKKSDSTVPVDDSDNSILEQ